MKILVWNALTPSQGKFNFFNNAFEKTLLKEANILADAGNDVDVIFTDATKHLMRKINKGVRPIYISNKEIYHHLLSFASSDEGLYKNNPETIDAYIQILKKKLASEYSAIIDWETPIPFLKKLYPDALIISQMPGFFCKGPYPYLISFDFDGCYKEGALYKHSKEILNYQSQTDILVKFKEKANKIFCMLDVFSKQRSMYAESYTSLSLIPLQISSHYNFRCDTKYLSQQEFLLDVASTCSEREGLIVTQYISKFSREQAITSDNYLYWNKQFKQIIFDPIFDKLSGISQYWVPFVDKIYSCSSSIAVQGLLFDKKVQILGNTFLSNIIDPTSKSNKNLLSFLLERTQILASLVFEPGFLDSYIKHALKLRSETEYTEKYPLLSDLVKDYSDKLLRSFNIDGPIKELRKLGLINHRYLTELDKFKAKISNPEIKFISFDVFDTLISRPLAKPADLYLLLQQYCFKLTNGHIDNFYVIRCDAEVNSRKLTDTGETTIELIYDYIFDNYIKDRKLLDLIKAYELRLEFDLSRRLDFGNQIYQIAKASGKRIIFISDMYLSKYFVKKLLEKNGYTVSDNLFVSCEVGASKKEGQLFDIVLDTLNILPAEMIHIGDNKVNDFENPHSKGIDTFRVNNPTQAMNRSGGWKDIFKSKNDISSSLLLGMAATELYSKPLDKETETSMYVGSDYYFGKYCLGPLVYSYVKWIVDNIESKTDRPDYILFLSREGKYCKDVYDLISKGRNLPKSIYLYASRRTLNIASLCDEKDIISIASAPYTDGSLLNELIENRFGIESSELSLNTKLGLSAEDKNLLVNTALKLKDSIFAEAESEREAYLKYLNDLGLIDPNVKIAIVDLGWKCRMQARLGQILNKKIEGYYYSTINESEYIELLGHKVHSFATEKAGKSNREFIVNNRHLMETLICCSDETLIKMRISGSVVHPVFSEKAIDLQRIMTCKIFEKGIESFAIEFNDLVGSLGNANIKFSIDFIDNLLRTSCTTKDANDIAILSKLSFIDFVGGISLSKKMVETKPKSSELKVVVASIPREPTNKNEDRKHPIENYLFSKLLSSRLYNKYKRDRKQYFEDSKSPLLRAYFRKFS